MKPTPFLFLLALGVAAGALAQSPLLDKIKVTATNAPTVVTSDRLSVDYAKNVGTFEGNVLAVDPRVTIRADKIIGFFGVGSNETRQIERLIAEGGVVISQENRKATAEKAEYFATEGKVVLTGQPRIEAPEGAVTGAKITFWHDQERVEVDADTTSTNRTRLIFVPPADKPKENE